MNDQLRQIQLLELEIIKSIHNICQENKITYYIQGGTMLGAIRHKGFIPWDDDIDIAMPRTDYEIFLKKANEWLPSKYKLEDKSCNPNYKCRFAKVCYVQSSTTVENIYVDIFPIDGMGNNYANCQKIIEKVKWERLMVRLVKEKTNYYPHFYSRAAEFIFRNIFMHRFVNQHKILKRLDKYLSEFDYNESMYVGAVLGATSIKECMPKSVYGKSALYDFEGEKFYGPENYDDYLKRRYGDYMTLPPEEGRRGHGCH